MLKRITIENFRSYRDATLELRPLTVLVGANASGKSNALEGLRLLSWIAQGNRLDSNPFTTNGYRFLRGGPNQLPYRGETHFSFVCETTHPHWNTYTITLTSLDDTLRIVGEELGSSHSEPPLFETRFWEEHSGKELRTRIKGARPTEKPLEASFTDQVAVLVQSQNLPRLDDAPGNVAEVRAVAAQYEAWLSALVFLDAHPAAMRGYSRKSASQLASDGSNLSGVLYNLCRDVRLKAEVLQLVSILPEHEVRDIGFIETPRDEVMVQLTETFGGVRSNTDVTLLSDGTLRVLAVAAAVLSAPEGGIVLVEEMDAGIHPGRAHKLLRELTATAARRNVRILTTSHDPALLDAVPDEALGGIVFCYRDPESGASTLVRMQDIQDYPALIAQGPVGRLLTRGLIDRAAKERTTPEERRQRALAWLDDLRAKAG